MYVYIGVPPNTATATVRIFVNDVNDNAPVLNARQYFATISEGTAPALLAELDVSVSVRNLIAFCSLLKYFSDVKRFILNLVTHCQRLSLLFKYFYMNMEQTISKLWH